MEDYPINTSESVLSTSARVGESSINETKAPYKRASLRRLFFKNDGKLRKNGNSSGDADVSAFENDPDVTPGSLEVWLDLPDTIKFDPLFSPFRHLYEQQHGTLEPSTLNTDNDITATTTKDGDQTEFGKTDNNLVTIEEVSPAPPAPRLSTELIDEPLENDDNQDMETKTEKKKTIETVYRVVKLSALVACWLLLTVSLLMNTEREDVILHTAVNGESIKVYNLRQTNERATVLVKLTGPFKAAAGGNQSLGAGVLYVWLYRDLQLRNESSREQNSTLWSIPLAEEDKLDFAPSETQNRILVLPEPLFSVASARDDNSAQDDSSSAQTRNGDQNEVATLDGTKRMNTSNDESTVSLRMRTTRGSVVPLTLSYQLSPLGPEDGIIYAAILLCGLYILIIFEIVNRTLAALLSSSLSIAVLALGGARPTLPELVSWLDVETLLLLFSMMLLVAILAETGLFDYLAVLAFEMTGGRTWPLINCLCLFTAVMSTVLDNVTTVLLMTPVTIRLCEVTQLNPIPILMSMVIYSNVGGTATPVGDPPNVIIASHPAVIQAGINFTTFTGHMVLGILFVCMQTYLQLRYVTYRDINKLRHSEPKDIRELRQELETWRRAAASLASYSRDEDLVRRALHKKVQKLKSDLNKRIAGGSEVSNDTAYCATLATIKQKYRIRDRQLLIKAVVCVTFVVVVFFLHAIPMLQRLSLGWTALLGALLLLLLAEREDLEPILARVEWSTLLFFAALFVLMEALSKLGLIAWIGNLTESLILQVGEESRLAVAILLVLWVSGLASAFVDNIPLTTMMIRVTTALGDPAGLGLPLQPLIWALSFGACLGGNGTLIGASANVVCAGVAEQHGYRFTFLQFLIVGFPVMIGNLLVASVYLLLAHCVFTWH